MGRIVGYLTGYITHYGNTSMITAVVSKVILRLQRISLGKVRAQLGRHSMKIGRSLEITNCHGSGYEVIPFPRKKPQ